MSTEPLTARGLERRIKRYLKGEVHTFAAITVPGLEHLARGEIEHLQSGCTGVVEPGIVEFHGTMELLYKTHLHCRIPNRIVFRIDQFTARSYPELFNKCKRVRWELYCGFVPQIAVVATGKVSRLHHTDNIANTVFDAIAEVMGGLGVTIQFTKKSKLAIHVRFRNDICTLSIDASGDLLYKRGVRRMVGAAPLRETTAAALLYAAEWNTAAKILDPCCGSGSIVLEALQLKKNIPAGANREFAFMAWPSFDTALWQRTRSASLQKINDKASVKVYANDSDAVLVQLLRDHELVGEDSGDVEFTCGNALDMRPELGDGSNGLIISNLPYGKRVDAHDSEIDTFYRNFGTWLKCSCKGWKFALLIADDHFERKAGIAATTLLSFSNGGIHVRLVAGHIGNSAEKIKLP